MRTEVFQFFNTPSGLAVRTSTQIHEDETLAWSFEDTGIIDNGIVQARAWGIVVRAAVTCIADQRGIAKCWHGTMDHGELAMAGMALWQCWLHDGSPGASGPVWADYEEEVNRALEAAFAAGIGGIRVQGPGYNYVVDFTAREQINLTNQTRRPVRRILIDPPATVPPIGASYLWLTAPSIAPAPSS